LRRADRRLGGKLLDAQRGDIETIVRSYLIAHPEVLERR